MATIAADIRQATHRELWAAKPVLREVYGHLYRRMAAACIDGLTVEVGGGSGNLKQFAPNVVSFDIVHEPWLDLVADAQSLPFADGCVANIVMLDVLHHIQYPLRFFREAVRVLQPGGRIVCVEPGITPLSRRVYQLFHEEPVDLTVDPLVDGVPDATKDPYLGNQGIPTLIVGRYLSRLNALVPQISLRESHWLSFAAYPLSGGFKRWSLLPAALARPLLAIEDRLERRLGPRCGFRLLAVFEKDAASTST